MVTDLLSLKLGSSGPAVRRLQMLLDSRLIPPAHLQEDGVFGLNTETAVKRFQTQHALIADGVVGPITWTALRMKQSQTDPPKKHPPAPGQWQPPGDWMSIAEQELGVHENSLPGQDNVRILEYHQTTTLHATTDEVPWCSSFVNWVMLKAGRKGTGSAAARSWLNWGVEITLPKTGAVTVIQQKAKGNDFATGSATGYHVAFYVSSTVTHVRLLGGNQSNSVKYSNFSLGAYDVKGYRWPV
jgi:uncharacterized protein (TIGR02594 family)